jgi:dinuclear metal center YbgI/SA1388 family protein
MVTLCNDIISYMEEIAPCCLAEDWDNVGLLIGNKMKKVKRLLLCLDVTADVVEEAVDINADMIISHHPLIFKGIKNIKELDGKGSIIYKLIKSNISVYSAHTNLDMAEHGVNAELARKLELCDTADMKSTAENGIGLGKIGYLRFPMTLNQFITHVKKSLHTGSLRVIGNVHGKVSKVATFCGSFDDDLHSVLLHKPDILVTGDVKYHTAMEALESKQCIIDAGHFNTEKIVLSSLQKLISEKFSDVEVNCSRVEKDPFKTY